jgi:hypothetical protein
MIDNEKLYTKVQALQEKLNQQTTAFDYEKAFDEEWREITREVFQESLGPLSGDRNKKKRFKVNLDGL